MLCLLRLLDSKRVFVFVVCLSVFSAEQSFAVLQQETASSPMDHTGPWSDEAE